MSNADDLIDMIRKVDNLPAGQRDEWVAKLAAHAGMSIRMGDDSMKSKIRELSNDSGLGYHARLVIDSLRKYPGL